MTSYQLTSVGISPEILAARMALTEGLESLRMMLATRLRGDGGVPRTRNKPQASDPAQAYVPGGNSRPLGRLNRPVAVGTVEAPTEILELAELSENHRMSEVDVGRARVDAQLDAQRRAFVQLLQQLLLGVDVDGAPEKVFQLFARRFHFFCLSLFLSPDRA